jgi:hypothetical protein
MLRFGKRLVKAPKTMRPKRGFITQRQLGRSALTAAFSWWNTHEKYLVGGIFY